MPKGKKLGTIKFKESGALKYKHVVFDIDNTITELQFVMDTMARYFNRESLPEEMVNSFQLSDVFQVTEEQNRDFWVTKEPYLVEHAILAKERLELIYERFISDDANVSFISARPKKLTDLTIQWLNRQGLRYSDALCIGSQSKLELIEKKFPKTELIVEDNPDFFIEKEGRGDILDTICVDYSYNLNSKSTYRVDRLTGEEI